MERGRGGDGKEGRKVQEEEEPVNRERCYRKHREEEENEERVWEISGGRSEEENQSVIIGYGEKRTTERREQ